MLGFDWLKKSAVVKLDQLADMAGFVRYGTSAGLPVSPQTAVQVAAVFCAVRVIAEDIAKMPVRVMSEDFDDNGMTKQTVARDHWATRLLSRRPNEFQTSFEFREYALLSAVLDKGFLGVKNINSRGEIVEILPVPMGSWSVLRHPNQWGHYFEVYDSDSNTIGSFEPSAVMYLRGPSLDGWRALPAISAAREAIGLSLALEKQHSRLAGQGGKPSGVLSFENALNPEQRTKLRETWQDKFGPNGEGGVAILDQAAKFESMVMKSVDAQYIETRQFQVEEVARAFRVHPNKLMHSGNQSTFASAESFNRSHVTDALMPWVKRFEEVADRDILGNKPGLRVDLDEHSLLRGDFKDQGEYYTKALGSGGQPGWMTPNEIRAEVGLNPLPEEWANQVPQGAMNDKGASDGNEG